ncbi:hypothetical protein [Paenibacillus sp. sgz302251]|uniref:hypothetical protein n=1 Tax=Paenibacillus sp. sgz302251 TaxID=3414493 RepID=UPI003C7B93E1
MDTKKIEEIFHDLLERWYDSEFCYPDISEESILQLKKEKEDLLKKFKEALN